MNKPSDQQGASLEGEVKTALAVLRLHNGRREGLEYQNGLRALGVIEAALASKASPDDQRQDSPPTEAAAAELEYTDPDDVFLSQGTDDVPCLQVPGRILVRFTPGSLGRAYELFSGNTPTASAAREDASTPPGDACVRHACKRVRMEMQARIDALSEVDDAMVERACAAIDAFNRRDMADKTPNDSWVSRPIIRAGLLAAIKGDSHAG